MRSTKSTWMHEYFDHQNVGCSCKQGFLYLVFTAYDKQICQISLSGFMVIFNGVHYPLKKSQHWECYSS